MENLFKHFWILCGVWCGFGNAIYFRIRLQKSISEGKITKPEVNKFTLGLLLALFVPCIILWALQMISGPQATHDFETWRPVQRNIGFVVMVICWISLFLWVWFFKGAASLSKYYDLAGYNPKFINHPFVFKGLTLLLLVGALFFTKDVMLLK
ncbi:hypothetical protein [Desulfosudis oleivorans]|uniref:Uncharacterized protein n=1 Tax=Desulfosudis oleivorans (strain DSM 6200 / JCM 39069 / Hxd3) TaxID=96561 RepID=A8ZXQ8_DESOH|nr:hypothetical protein [Desulfosudis oleivorans]ABW67016.1 hypothetical protein Dole_1210 [Desulfosudis oleivorans Hxd3]